MRDRLGLRAEDCLAQPPAASPPSSRGLGSAVPRPSPDQTTLHRFGNRAPWLAHPPLACAPDRLAGDPSLRAQAARSVWRKSAPSDPRQPCPWGPRVDSASPGARCQPTARPGPQGETAGAARARAGRAKSPGDLASSCRPHPQPPPRASPAGAGSPGRDRTEKAWPWPGAGKQSRSKSWRRRRCPVPGASLSPPLPPWPAVTSRSRVGLSAPGQRR